MANNRNKLLLLEEYIESKECEIERDLKPYYEQLDERERSCMNTYGIATPHEKCLLKEISDIYSLRSKIKSCNSIEELVEKIKEEIEGSKDKDDVIDLQSQLKYVDEYLQKDTLSNSTTNDFQSSSKRTFK